jgi:hypothetical protein
MLDGKKYGSYKKVWFRVTGIVFLIRAPLSILIQSAFFLIFYLLQIDFLLRWAAQFIKNSKPR